MPGKNHQGRRGAGDAPADNERPGDRTAEVPPAHADVSLSVGVGGPTYYEPAPVYQAPPPVYQAPPPVYYQPAPPAYYQPAPPPHYRQAQPYYPAERPRLSDMQQRALDNCSLLAPREQGRCRATVLSTTR